LGLALQYGAGLVLAMPALAHPKQLALPPPPPPPPPPHVTPNAAPKPAEAHDKAEAAHNTADEHAKADDQGKADAHAKSQGQGKREGQGKAEGHEAPKDKATHGQSHQDVAEGHKASTGDTSHPTPPAQPPHGSQPTSTGTSGKLPDPFSDPPVTPAQNIAEAIAAIAAAPGGNPPASEPSEPSDMMKLGAGGSADARKRAEAQARGRRLSGVAANLASGLATFRPDEILAHNLSASVLAQLKASGKYTISPGSSANVTRLLLPDTMSADDELARLQAQFPDQGFGLNYLYNSYRGAGEGRRGAEGDAAAVPAGGAKMGCDAARCYGPTLIGWHPDLATCAHNVVVGIIDTGLDEKHPAVRRLKVMQLPDDADKRGDNWHGTGVAALLAGARESSTPGLIPDAHYVVVDAFFASGEEGEDAKGSGYGRQTITDTDHLLWALDTLQKHRAQVVNMSLVGPSDPAMHAAIRKMASAGVVFVAAAGNGGPAGPAAFPAAYPEVIAVTAVDHHKRAYAEANHGGYIDVAAPGVRVWTALPGERQGFLSGTSFAAPFISAIAAATYNSTPLRAAPLPGRHLNPKEEVIGRMTIEQLGRGEAGARNQMFGLGLAHAPASCAPPRHLQPQVAEERAPAARSSVPGPAVPSAEAAGRQKQTAGWQTQVQKAASAR
jgi:hypothetical protein